MAINPTPASITAGTLDAWEYLASYADLMDFYGADQAAAANHYNLTGGPVEGRSITFNAWAYMASYEDLMNHFGFDAIGAAMHYVVTGRAEGRTVTFDAWAYMASYEDLMSYFGFDAIGAAMHYVVTGHPVEGRTVTFDTQAYLDANPDLQAAYGNDADGGLSNASKHYVVTGRAEIAAGLREESGQGGQTFELTAGVDLFPDGLDNSGNDTIIGEGGTLSPGDDLDGGSGSDVLRYSTDVTANEAGFKIDNVERFQVTADAGATATFDLSGSTGFETLASVNSTGNVVFQQVTGIPQTVEVQNVTLEGDVTVQIQDALVAGSADTINVSLMNSDGVGVLSIGSMTDANSGIETINIITSQTASTVQHLNFDMTASQAASTVQHLNVDMTTLNLAGDQDLTIVDPLNGFETTVNADAMTGDLTLDLTNNTTAGVTYTGSQGADTVTFAGTTGDHIINTGTGADTVTVTGTTGNYNINTGTGADTVTFAGTTGDHIINLGAGDDSTDIAPDELTVLDVINGGAGNDTLTLTGTGFINLAEAEQISDLETIVMTTGETILTVTDNMVTSITGSAGGLTVEMGVGGNTVDITGVAFSNTNLLTIEGSTGDDLVIADDATVNAKATINFGNSAGDNNDTLRVINGATITADDLDNISGLDVIELVPDSTLPQTWNITLNPSAISANNNALNINVSPLVEAGSVLNLDTSLLPEDVAVTVDVINNPNVTVNVTDPNDVVNVVTRFVLTAGVDLFPDGLDNSGNDTIIGEGGTLSPGDDLDGGSGTDVLQYHTDVTTNEAGFKVDNVERFQVTADTGATATFDLSGSTGFETLASVNSTGSVVFQQVTGIPQTVEVQNVTLAGDVTVQIQNALVAGSSDTINVALMNSDGVGILSIGSMTAASSGIETLNVTTSQAASTVQHLNVDMTTLNLAGDQDLTIVDPLNGFETTVNAGSMTGNLSLDLTNNTTAGVTYTGSQGADTVTFAGTAGDHTIATGDGNDTVIAGMGNDTIDLGEGNDSIDIAPGGLTVLDTIDGGAGNDTLTLTGADDIELSEAERVSDIETFVMTAGGTLLDVTDNMVTSITGPAGGLTVDMGVGYNTVDITDVTFSNPNLLTIEGSTGDDLVIADNATVNANATINFGNSAGDDNDTLRVVNGATITSDDMSNITGLDNLELVPDSALPQTWNITLNPAAIDDTTDSLHINISPLVAAGSVLNLDASLVPAGVVVNVNTNSNVTVNTIADPNGVVNVGSVLEFTGNADTLTGAAGADLFTATSPGHVAAADSADGLGGTDTMRVDFAVYDGRTLESLFNHANISNIEVLEFNTNDDTWFHVNTADAADSSAGGDYDFTTFTLGGGNNWIDFNGATAASYTVNDNGGNNIVADETGTNDITFIGGPGNDKFSIHSGGAMDANDSFAPGEGTNEVVIVDSSADTAAIEVDIAAGEVADFIIGGVMLRFEIYASNIADADVRVRVNNADLYDNSRYDLNASDDVFFSASAVTDGSAGADVRVNTDRDNDGFGNALLVGGAGDDSISIWGTAGGAAGSVDGATDGGGMIGLLGADTMTLRPLNGAQDNIVYKTAQDGALEGQNTGFDTINNFEAGTDKIIFSVSTAAGSYVTTTETGSGFMGDTMDKNTDDVLDVVTNPAVSIDLTTAELAAYTGTALTDADLVDLTAVASFINTSLTTGLTNDTTDQVLVFSIQGASDTAFYSFASNGVNGTVETGELSILAVVESALLTGADYAYG